MGTLERTIDSLPQRRAGRRSANAVLTGGTEDLDLHRLVRHGVVPHGHLTGVHGGKLTFADDLAKTVHAAEENAVRFRANVDDHVRRTGLDVPVEPARPGTEPGWADDSTNVLDLHHAGIGSVVWATGFRRDFSWLRAPVLDRAGEPVQRRGVTAADGLYFLGLRWMHRRSSSFLDGVGADAEYLAAHIAERTRVLAAAA
jgi:putative flavoprotein involved in K+ transport